MSAVKENLFEGPIGAEYEILRLMCPNHPALVARLGRYVGGWRCGAAPLAALEIGCGAGAGTRAMLSARPDLALTAIDSAANMLDQARVNLADEVAAKRVSFVQADALGALKAQPDESLDLVASSYALHNFGQDYRVAVLREIHRVIKPGGRFVNGDRYAIDDHAAHLAATQADVRRWFKLFKEIDRLDLLEEWIVHLCSDESPAYIMYFEPALAQLRALGFAPVTVEYRDGVDTLVSATKA